MGIQLNEPLPDDLRSCTVVSSDEQTATIGELVDGQATLLVFVRHFGCIGCSENIGLLQPRLKELEGLDTRIIIIGCGAPAYIEGFKERHRLLFTPAEVFSDASLATHQAAGLMYSIWGGFRPRALLEQVRAFVNGNVSSGVQGDIKQQAGAIYTDTSGCVRLYHRNESLGDHVSPQKVVDTALAAWLDTNPDLV